MSVPDRGDVFWIDTHPQSGHEQFGRRPALVLSPSDYNEQSSLAVMVPITSREKGYPFELKLPEQGKADGVVLADQVKSFNWKSRNAEPFDTPPDHVLKLATLMVRELIVPEEYSFLDGTIWRKPPSQPSEPVDQLTTREKE